MREFELRFSIKNVSAFRKKLLEFGFKRGPSYKMTDLVFENQNPMTGYKKIGFYVVRVRLVQGRKPFMEMKKYAGRDTWEETPFSIEPSSDVLALLSHILWTSKFLSKTREEFRKGKLLVTIDDVKHLGKFTEIEGPPKLVKSTAKALGFNLNKRAADYGYQMAMLHLAGKLPLPSLNDMQRELAKFNR